MFPLEFLGDVSMPVFLSHKREDKAKAMGIAKYLGAKGIICYVDVMDAALQTTDDITATLMRRVEQCTHLMAVISAYTERSWWVPFEVGVGTHADKRITSYQADRVELPLFLQKWPILKSTRDLNLFAQSYKIDLSVPVTEGRAPAPRIRTAGQFHSELKASLRR